MNYLKEMCLDLMEKAEVAYLTLTGSEGYPETRAMFNLRRKEQFPDLTKLFESHRDDFMIYFTTNTSSRKTEHIVKSPRSSVYYCRPGEWSGLNLVGDIEVVDDARTRKLLWQEGWTMYYPGGSSDPDYTVLRMRPLFARCYHQLKVFQIDFPGDGNISNRFGIA